MITLLDRLRTHRTDVLGFRLAVLEISVWPANKGTRVFTGASRDQQAVSSCLFPDLPCSRFDPLAYVVLAANALRQGFGPSNFATHGILPTFLFHGNAVRRFYTCEVSFTDFEVMAGASDRAFKRQEQEAASWANHHGS